MTSPLSYISVIISPLKRTWPFIWTNLNSFHPRIICTKFDWFWPTGPGEEDFSNLTLSLLSPLGERLFRYYLPLERDYSLSLKIPKSSLSKDDVCQVWLKLAQWFWKQEAQGPHRSPESYWVIFRLWTHATLLFFIAIRSHCL
jgi:hypothetical protein